MICTTIPSSTPAAICDPASSIDLRSAGPIELLRAESLEEAHSILREFTRRVDAPPILLIDFSLPHVDQICRRARVLLPGTELLVVHLSGYPSWDPLSPQGVASCSDAVVANILLQH